MVVSTVKESVDVFSFVGSCVVIASHEDTFGGLMKLLPHLWLPASMMIED